jgi:RimJ/RimL family protein N-acetyltransferase
MSRVHFRTARLVVRDLAASDAPALFRYRSDPRVREYQPFDPRSVDDAAAFIAANTGRFDAAGEWYQLGVEKDGELIGDIGIHFLEPAAGECEIGYTIDPAYQRLGFGREAVQGVIAFLVGELGKRRILAFAHPANAASVALLKSLGFREAAGAGGEGEPLYELGVGDRARRSRGAPIPPGPARRPG